ncbi:hypothetical protein BDZ97DRAFT_1766063 [Flammula alnicola]|nr:hypothetical protein BDZ97DRAFT_1766063 [Flammula alnicola]
MTSIGLAKVRHSTSLTLIEGKNVDDSTLTACATLFSENYGVWSSQVQAPLKPGTRVRMTAKRLRDECLGDPANSMLSLCHVNGQYVGHAFATCWKSVGGNICWITQLVVSSHHRERGIATSLIRCIKEDSSIQYTSMGIASSHPAACLALAKAARVNMRNVDLEVIKKYAIDVTNSTPISYIKHAALRGSLFHNDAQSGAISSVFTKFFVDHREPVEALVRWKHNQDLDWPLGELLEGHEFFFVVPVN